MARTKRGLTPRASCVPSRAFLCTNTRVCAGAIICRCIVELLDSHKVDTFVSVAGPLLGMYVRPLPPAVVAPPPASSLTVCSRWGHSRGIPKNWTVVPQGLHNISDDLLYLTLYQKSIQLSVSVGNYWTDSVHMGSYLINNLWLPKFNNEVVHPLAAEFKSNFLRLNKLVALGGPDDGIIVPYQSEFFGYYAPGSAIKFAPMAEQRVYKEDLFGLRTLDQSGRLEMHNVTGVTHDDWIHDENLFAKFILPHLT